MPTLSFPNTATVNITVPGGYITVACATGEAMQLDWVSPGSITGTRIVRQITEDVGPFTDSTVVTLRSLSGSPTYTAALGGGLTTAQVAATQALVSAAGNPSAALLVCGDSILRIGVRDGFAVTLGTAIPGAPSVMGGSLTGQSAGAGSLVYTASTQSLQYTAPGDSGPGAALVATIPGVYDIASANGAWLRCTVLPDQFGGSNITSVATLAASPSQGRTMRGLPEQLQARLGNRFRIFNGCMPGSHTRHLRFSLDAALAQAAAAGVTAIRCIAQAGTNNLQNTSPYGVADQTRILSDIEEFLQYARSKGVGVLMLPIPMRSFQTAPTGDPHRAAWNAANNGLAEVCARNGALFSAVYDSWIDPASIVAARTNFPQDGIHPSKVGSWYPTSKLIAEGFESWIGVAQSKPFSSFDTYDASTNPSGNHVPTPWQEGTGGTAGTGGSGTIAADWHLVRSSGADLTAAGSKLAATDGGPDWQLLTMTGSTTNGQIIKYEYESTSLAAGITTLVAGMVVSATLEIMFLGDAGIRAIDFRLTPVGAARNDPRIWIDFDNSFEIPANTEKLVLAIPETEALPAGTTGVRPQFYVTCGTLNAGTARIAVRRLDIRSR